MRAVFVSFTVLAVIASTAYADLIVRCTNHNDPDYVEYIPHPCMCDTYYVCDGMEPIPMSCPRGLYWNRYTNTCDSPANAYCIRDPACWN